MLPEDGDFNDSLDALARFSLRLTRSVIIPSYWDNAQRDVDNASAPDYNVDMFPVQFDEQRAETSLDRSTVTEFLNQTLLKSINGSFVIMDRNYRLKTILTDGEEWPTIDLKKPCYELVHNAECPCEDCPVTALFKEGKLAATKKCLVLSDESGTLWFEVKAYPLFDEQFNVAYAITAFRLVECEQIDLVTPDNEVGGKQSHLDETTVSEFQGSLNEKDQSLMKLSNRETEVLRLMADGKTNSEIAAMLSISLHTVKRHTTHIFGKLGVNNRTQASVLLVDGL